MFRNVIPLNRFLPVVALLFFSTALDCVADDATAVAPETTKPAEVAKDKNGRLILREERPENSRGWITIAKSTYWPLCYEALDHLEAARSMIGKSNNAELSDELDKSGAWLKLAASAAMTDGKAGIVFTGDLVSAAGNLIREGKWEHTDEDTQELISLAEVCMAKSHVMRAKRSNKDYSSEYAGNAKTPAKIASAEIQIARRDANRVQLHYDMEQSIRHLNVAKVYLDAAAKANHIKLPEAVAEEVPTINGTVPDELSNFEGEQVLRINEYFRFIEQERLRMAKKFADD